MNSLLLEMVAARATAAGNPAVAEMLARLRASPSDADPAQTVQELLAQFGPGNPMASLIAKHLAEPKRQRVIDVDPVEEIPEAAGNSAPPDTGMSELRAHVESMFAELTVLRDRTDRLAAALGACCLCWGEDAGCRACRGRGRPGFAIPDELQFEELVLPAVLALRAQRARFGRPSPNPQTKSTQPGA